MLCFHGVAVWVLSIDFLVRVARFSISRNGVKVSHLSKSELLFGQWCPTLCHPMDCSPPGSSLHGILQARILEWVAIPFSSRSSQPRDPTQVSHTASGFFTISKKLPKVPSWWVILVQTLKATPE